MKKRVILLSLALVCLLILSACGCKHETWLDADCVTPKTCAACGETEGAPLGHTWAAATCETAKTCEACGEKEGEALGHKWVEATCEAPKTCENCKLTEGEALGHDWADATTEAPKTCANCGNTEGSKIETDPRFTTAETAAIQGKWSFQVPMNGELIGEPNYPGEFTAEILMTLGNDGTMTMTMGIANVEQFSADMSAYIADTLYAELAASGLSKADADAAMKEAYGMNVEEYAAYSMSSIDFNSILSGFNVNGVYYVNDGKLYAGTNWEADLNPTEFTLDGDSLTLEGDLSGMGAEESIFTRVVE